MPDEYIRREAAIEEIDKWLDAVGTALVGKGLSYYGELIGCIEDTPAADVAPVVHGEWIGNKGGFWEMATCSMCDEKYPCVGMAPNFCPNCGARMDGAAE